MPKKSEFLWRAINGLLWAGVVLLLAPSTFNNEPQPADSSVPQATLETTPATAPKTAPQEAQKSPALKIVNWNVLYAFNHGQSVDLGVEWISEQHADVVALQELNGLTEDSLNKLASRWGHPHSAILKEHGFPVGLTSALPIQVIKRQIDGFHHGYLHCVTHQTHFFVVHFWPGKDHEGKQVAGEIKALIDAGENVILLGDFNTHSRRDLEFLAQRSNVKAQFNVVDMFERIGMVDLVAKHSPQAKFSFPSPITIPRWSKDEKELLSKRQRIDFIFAERELASASSAGRVVTSEEVEKISDHYPVIAEIKKSE